MAYRVMIVDDFMMSRQVFENAVAQSDDYTLAGSFDNAEKALDYIAHNSVDLVIMDVVMTSGINGIEAAKRIKEMSRETKILVVTSMPEASFLERARKANVDSFWYKEVQEQPILEVMNRTMLGECVYPDVAPVINVGLARSNEFTKRELEVLRGLTDGASNIEIAESLGITERTVRMHIGNMLSKTGFRSRLELALQARIGGIAIPD